ncbi:redoxin domain-containing protein [Halobacteriovorax sp. XZX-3]|uniref:redoxin domain-containing protein n=1 Tax=unclassified Halobacteriovorax TaxID=2639665 RepID=UPI001304C69F|nr:redoxin domain-containing protein [Halobacteriovorax sp. DA5]
MKVLLISLFSILTFSQELGLGVGTKSPNIEIKNIEGTEIILDDSDKKTVLVFYRGSWCPYCMKQLQSIQTEVMPKLDKSSKLVAISVDKKMIAHKMKKKYQYTFDIVSDPKASLLLAFNIVNKLDDKLVQKYKQSYKIDIEGDSGQTHHMVAHPAVFVIRNGKITYQDIHKEYKDRTKNDDILAALE